MNIPDLRWVYLLITFVGFAVALAEWRAATWLSKSLRRQAINGLRQMMASHFATKALLMLTVQSLSLASAMIRLDLPMKGLLSEAAMSAYVTQVSWIVVLETLVNVVVTILTVVSRAGRLAQMAAEESVDISRRNW